MHNKAHLQIKQYVQSGISEPTYWKQVIIEKETFVTKGEIESNFLTTLTDKPKLNH